MEILKHINNGNLEIIVKRVERQKVEIISTVDAQSSVAIPKKADNPENASYSSKNITVKTDTGDIHFGIAITRSIR